MGCPCVCAVVRCDWFVVSTVSDNENENEPNKTVMRHNSQPLSDGDEYGLKPNEVSTGVSARAHATGALPLRALA